MFITAVCVIFLVGPRFWCCILMYSHHAIFMISTYLKVILPKWARQTTARCDDVTKETVEWRHRGNHPVFINKRSNDLHSAPCHWRVHLIHLHNVQIRFMPENGASVYSILYDIYLFTHAVTKLINYQSAINRKQNGLHWDVLSWHSIKTEWLSALRGTYDLCLKNLINIACIYLLVSSPTSDGARYICSTPLNNLSVAPWALVNSLSRRSKLGTWSM